MNHSRGFSDVLNTPGYRNQADFRYSLRPLQHDSWDGPQGAAVRMVCQGRVGAAMQVPGEARPGYRVPPRERGDGRLEGSGGAVQQEMDRGSLPQAVFRLLFISSGGCRPLETVFFMTDSAEICLREHKRALAKISVVGPSPGQPVAYIIIYLPHDPYFFHEMVLKVSLSLYC